jgi:hypothetical protein
MAALYAFNMESKRLALLHEAVPAAKIIAVLVNAASPGAELQTRDVMEAAPRLGVEVIIFNAHGAGEFESLFAAMAERKAGALLVTADPSLIHPTWAPNRAGGATQTAGDLRMASARCRGWPNELWDGADGRL